MNVSPVLGYLWLMVVLCISQVHLAQGESSESSDELIFAHIVSWTDTFKMLIDLNEMFNSSSDTGIEIFWKHSRMILGKMQSTGPKDLAN